MNKIAEFFHPRRLPFHFLLAIVVTLVLAACSFWILSSYTHHGDELSMPDYRGKNYNDLRDSATVGKFVFEVSNVKIFDESKPEGTVVKQEPDPGGNVKRGRKVLLTLSTAVPRTVKMPQLAGNITLRQAKHILEDSGLELGTVGETESDAPNLVLGQSREKTGKAIAAGTDIKQGEKIKLEVGVARRNPVDYGGDGDVSDDTEADPQAGNIEF